MSEDERCCGTGTCIIDAQGRCWCGQQWDGMTLCRPTVDETAPSAPEPVASREASSPEWDANSP